MELDVDETETLPPADAFALLGHEIRIAILRSLYEAGGTAGPGRLGYAALKDRVGVRDSGQFNYHLSALRGRFVRKYDAGYGLTYAGTDAYRTVAAGAYQGNATLEPTLLEAGCPNCEAPVEFAYQNDTFSIACSACPARLFDLPIPHRAVDTHDRDGLLQTLTLRAHQLLLPLAWGVCPHCGGGIDGGLCRDVELPFDPGPNWSAYATFECRCCDAFHAASPGTFVCYEPFTVAAFATAGASVFTLPVWENPLFRSDEHMTIVTDDGAVEHVDVDLPMTEASPDFRVQADCTVTRLADGAPHVD